MSKKCPGCNKTVYFAERQVKDGVDWHGSCLIRHVQDQKKGAQAAGNPFQSYRAGASPSAPRREMGSPNSGSRGSLDLAPAPTPTSPTPTTSLHYQAPPPVENVSVGSENSNLSSSEASSTVSPQSPVLRDQEKNLSNSQLSKVEEFLLQQTAPSVVVHQEPAAEEQPEGGEGSGGGEGTGFCCNCGEPRGTDGAMFCSNCGEAF